MFFPAIGESNWYEAISLIFAILMSTGFSAISEYRNEQKVQHLREEASKLTLKFTVTVNWKKSSLMISLKGDQILLQSGDKVPVDGYSLRWSLESQPSRRP